MPEWWRNLNGLGCKVAASGEPVLWLGVDNRERSPIDSPGPWDIWWPATGEDSFFVLRPGMAYEIAFYPYDAVPLGILIEDSEKRVTYRFTYELWPDVTNGYYANLEKQRAGENDAETTSGGPFRLETCGEYACRYRLRTELDHGELVFRWKAGQGSEEWETLGQEGILGVEGGDLYRLGLTIMAVPRSYSSVWISEAKLEWSLFSEQDSSNLSFRQTVQVAGPGFETVDGSSQWISPDPESGAEMLYCESPDYTQPLAQPNSASWCIELDDAGYYDVDAFIPSMPGTFTMNQTAVYEIEHAYGTAKVPLNQQEHQDEWVYLGTYYFDGNSTERCVRLTALTMVNEMSYTVYDRVRWTRYD